MKYCIVYTNTLKGNFLLLSEEEHTCKTTFEHSVLTRVNSTCGGKKPKNTTSKNQQHKNIKTGKYTLTFAEFIICCNSYWRILKIFADFTKKSNLPWASKGCSHTLFLTDLEVHEKWPWCSGWNQTDTMLHVSTMDLKYTHIYSNHTYAQHWKV